MYATRRIADSARKKTEQPKHQEPWKIRHDYAWNWFAHHANQRVNMFNFFCVAAGVFITAYHNFSENSKEQIAPWFGVLGFCVAFCFMFLDFRNARLVEISESVLKDIENKKIFSGKTFTKGGQRIKFGLLRRDHDRREKIGLLKGRIKHALLIPVIELCIALYFLVFIGQICKLLWGFIVYLFALVEIYIQG